jgi:hypothetical protein
MELPKKSFWSLFISSLFFVNYVGSSFAGLYAASYIPAFSIDKTLAIRLGLVLTAFFFWFAIVLVPFIPKNPVQALWILCYPYIFCSIEYVFISHATLPVIESLVSIAFYFTGSVTLGYAMIVFIKPLFIFSKPWSDWKKSEWLEYSGVAGLQLIFFVPAAYTLYLLAQALRVKFSMFSQDSLIVQVLYFFALLWPLIVQSRIMLRKMSASTK